MIFDILTIFPDLLESPLKEGILRRALQQEQIQVKLHNIRDFAFDRHKMTDDRPFGGGEGMVMKAEPLTACLKSVCNLEETHVVLMSPRGKRFDQRIAEQLAGRARLTFICGRYEGIDERFTTTYVDEEISIGDYILTGGELAAMVMIDTVTRLLPGVLGCQDSAENDTFSRNLLKHPQYTRPRVFEGQEVPELLLSGDHRAIEQYRFIESVKLTLQRRPESLKTVVFSPAEKKILKAEGLLGTIKGWQGD